ncbi:aminodeoxychorismate lyase [Niallia sp. NCCP-28]|uniref:aminodeoxychorismate lyase n=1 Tax=Niallia sp. NCCP-28 TaxID=2934712 RepID=UPI002089956D|nr:aminodeoxychorismate lyase [Niallia sp. NCCP-28]GKU84994.1 4-amino-4-deoxychorismate lyase [Niallia sp. NCCP-28]
MYIYLNGQIVKQEEAVISPFDHGFMYGLGLFETFRIYDGHPFLLDDHITRLNEGLQLLNINRVFNRLEVVKLLNDLLKANGLTNAYIRFNVSAGSGAIGLQTAPYINPTVIVYIKSLEKRNSMFEKKGQIVTIPRNTPEGRERLKSHHYLNNVFAKREVGDKLDVEGIFLTKDNYVAEGITSNLFWVKDHTLYTPCLNTGILNGITRRFIISLARNKGLRVEENFYPVEHLIEAEEVFTTNSIQEIVALSHIETHYFKGEDGEITAMLHKAYQQFTSSLWAMKEIGGIDDE